MRNLVVILLTFFAIAALAFPFPELLPRQRGGETDTVPAATSTDAQSSAAESSAGSASTTGDTPQSTGAEGDGSSSTPTSKSSKSTKTKNILLDPALGAGGILMKTPVPNDLDLYYKFGDNVTFVWNYTSLIISPTAVNMVAICTDPAPAQTWTIKSNLSISTTSIVWDTKPFANDKQTPLVMGKYTLLIYDNAKAQTAMPQAGHLGQFGAPAFGMYAPRDPTPLASYECAICESSAVTNIDSKLMRMLVGTGTIFLLSLFWFARGSI